MHKFYSRHSPFSFVYAMEKSSPKEIKTTSPIEVCCCRKKSPNKKDLERPNGWGDRKKTVAHYGWKKKDEKNGYKVVLGVYLNGHDFYIHYILRFRFIL